MSPYTVLLALLRRWRLVAGLPLLASAFVLLVFLVRGPRFEAQSRFAPQTDNGSAMAFAGLAAQLGVPIGGASSTESVQFYAALVESRELLEAAAATPYEDGSDSLRSLMDQLGIEAATEDERLQRAVDWLRGKTVVTVDQRANLVTVVTEAATPELAVGINRRLLELVNEFNVERRRGRAAAERSFVEGRLQEAQSELRAGESALGEFLESNRRYEGSPELVLEFGRLQREVDLRQAVFTSLAQRHEQARVDEVRATPVVTVIEGPERSAVPAGGLVRGLALAVLIGGLFGVGGALVAEYLAEERRRDPGAVAELRERLPMRAEPKGTRAGPEAGPSRPLQTPVQSGTKVGSV